MNLKILRLKVKTIVGSIPILNNVGSKIWDIVQVIKVKTRPKSMPSLITKQHQNYIKWALSEQLINSK